MIQLLIAFLILIYTWVKPPEQVFQLTFQIWKHFVWNTILMATRHLAWDQGLWSSRNSFQWVGTTHWKSLEVLGTLRKSHKSPKDLADDLRTSFTFPSFLYYYVWIWGSASTINNLFTHLTLFSNWGLPWNYMFWIVSLERYINSLYIFHNLYIELDCLALSQISYLNIEA